MQLLQQGASYEQIGALLGHSNPKTTRRYAKLRAEQVRSLLEKNNNIIPFSKTCINSEFDNRE